MRWGCPLKPSEIRRQRVEASNIEFHAARAIAFSAGLTLTQSKGGFYVLTPIFFDELQAWRLFIDCQWMEFVFDRERPMPAEQEMNLPEAPWGLRELVARLADSYQNQPRDELAKKPLQRARVEQLNRIVARILAEQKS